MKEDKIDLKFKEGNYYLKMDWESLLIINILINDVCFNVDNEKGKRIYKIMEGSSGIKDKEKIFLILEEVLINLGLNEYDKNIRMYKSIEDEGYFESYLLNVIAKMEEDKEYEDWLKKNNKEIYKFSKKYKKSLEEIDNNGNGYNY